MVFVLIVRKMARNGTGVAACVPVVSLKIRG